MHYSSYMNVMHQVARATKKITRRTQRPVPVLSKYKSKIFYVSFFTTYDSRIIPTFVYKVKRASLITHNDHVHRHGMIWNKTKHHFWKKKNEKKPKPVVIGCKLKSHSQLQYNTVAPSKFNYEIAIMCPIDILKQNILVKAGSDIFK